MQICADYSMKGKKAMWETKKKKQICIVKLSGDMSHLYLNIIQTKKIQIYKNILNTWNSLITNKQLH